MLPDHFLQYPWARALAKLQAPQAGGTSDCHVLHRQLLAGMWQRLARNTVGSWVCIAGKRNLCGCLLRKPWACLWAPQRSHSSGESARKAALHLQCIFFWIVSLLHFSLAAKPCLHLFLAVLVSHSKRISQKTKKNKQNCILAHQQKAAPH